MNRAERRRLESKASKLMASVYGSLLSIDPARHMLLVYEDKRVDVIQRDDAPALLARFSLMDLHGALEATRSEYPGHFVPCVIVIGEWATCAYVETFRLVRGGVA